MNAPDWLRGIPREWFAEIRLAFLSGWKWNEQHAGHFSAEDAFSLHVEGRALDASKEQKADVTVWAWQQANATINRLHDELHTTQGAIWNYHAGNHTGGFTECQIAPCRFVRLLTMPNGTPSFDAVGKPTNDAPGGSIRVEESSSSTVNWSAPSLSAGASKE